MGRIDGRRWGIWDAHRLRSRRSRRHNILLNSSAAVAHSDMLHIRAPARETSSVKKTQVRTYVHRRPPLARNSCNKLCTSKILLYVPVPHVFEEKPKPRPQKLSAIPVTTFDTTGHVALDTDRPGDHFFHQCARDFFHRSVSLQERCVCRQGGSCGLMNILQGRHSRTSRRLGITGHIPETASAVSM